MRQQPKHVNNIMDNIKTQELNAVMANAMQQEESRRQVFKMETSDGERKRTLVLEEAPAVQNPMNRDVRSCVGCFFYQNPDYSCQDLGRFGLPSCVQFVKVVKKREVIFALKTRGMRNEGYDGVNGDNGMDGKHS